MVFFAQLNVFIAKQALLSLEFQEKIDDYLKLIGLNPFQHFFCFNESNIIKLGIACSKSSQCNIHCNHRFPSHTYKAWMKSYICQIKHRKAQVSTPQMLTQVCLCTSKCHDTKVCFQRQQLSHWDLVHSRRSKLPST